MISVSYIFLIQSPIHFLSPQSPIFFLIEIRSAWRKSSLAATSHPQRESINPR